MLNKCILHGIFLSKCYILSTTVEGDLTSLGTLLSITAIQCVLNRCFHINFFINKLKVCVFSFHEDLSMLAVVDLRCCALAFSSFSEQQLLLLQSRGAIIVAHWPTCPEACRNLPRPGRGGIHVPCCGRRILINVPSGKS